MEQVLPTRGNVLEKFPCIPEDILVGLSDHAPVGGEYKPLRIHLRIETPHGITHRDLTIDEETIPEEKKKGWTDIFEKLVEKDVKFREIRFYIISLAFCEPDADRDEYHAFIAVGIRNIWPAIVSFAAHAVMGGPDNMYVKDALIVRNGSPMKVN